MTFTKERIIEELKSSTQNASGMFEISEDTICNLMSLLTAPPAPVVPDERYQQLSELYHSQEKRLFKLAQRIKGPSFDKYAYSPSQAIDVLATAIFGEKEDNGSACRATMLQGAEPTKSGLTLREGLAAIRNSGIAIDAEKIQAERDAINEPTCFCRTCRPLTVSDMRFVVCPECGNKRCPHANDHRNACTGSNDPGQEGSAYPAAPQQEAK